MSKFCWAGGMAPARVSVVDASASRLAWSFAGARAWVARVIFPAMLSVRLPLLLATRLSDSCIASTGVITPRIDAVLDASVVPIALSFLRLAGWKSSTTVWPGSIVMTVSIASPPNRSW